MRYRETSLCRGKYASGVVKGFPKTYCRSSAWSAPIQLGKKGIRDGTLKTYEYVRPPLGKRHGVSVQQHTALCRHYRDWE